MIKLDPLSATLQAALPGLGVPLDQVFAAAAGDLDPDSRFGAQWLIVTPRELLVLDADGSPRHRVARDKLKAISAETLIGGGAILIETADKSIEPIRYSNAGMAPFGYLARWLGEHIEFAAGRKKEEPVWDFKQEKKFCPRCGLPLPDEFSPCPGCTKKGRILLRILSYLKPYPWYTAILVVFAVVSIGLELVPPYFTRVLVDDVLASPQTLAAHPATGRLATLVRSAGTGAAALGVAVGALALATLISTTLGIFRGRLHVWLGLRLATDIRAELFECLHSLSLRFFDKRQTGTVISHVTQDSERVLGFVTDGLQMIVRNLLIMVGIAGILFVMIWRLALFVLLPIPIISLGTRWFWTQVRSIFHRAWARHSRMHDVVNDAFSGVRVVRAFAQEEQSTQRFQAINEEYRDYITRGETLFATFFPMMQVSISVAMMIVWLVGGWAVLANNADPKQGITLGTIMTFMVYLGMFYGPLMNASPLMNWASRSLTAAERIFEVLDAEPEQTDDGSLIDMPAMTGEVEFKGLTFGYESHKPVLKSVDLHVKPGEMIGLVGHSGAGKSTLINLICRFYRADSGSLAIDGTEIGKIRLRDLRRQTGVVLQEPFLFNGSIAQNIAFAKPRAPMAEIIAAARAANAHEFIVKMPDGYDSEVGERGSKLSGGERQRISIARAILHNPRILILDEATSSVDVQTEKKIQEAVNRLVKSRTTFAIAHRLSTLRNANRLFVMKDGKGIECGTHDELMAKKGEYFGLVNTQREVAQLKGETEAVAG